MLAAVRTLAVWCLVVASASTPLRAQTAGGTVTLKGQIVCSSCWHEEDRSKVAYGTKADLACALRCGKGGVPGALAVTDGGVTTLYLLEPGAYAVDSGETSWTGLTGKVVEATGVVRRDGEKTYLKVDAVKVVDSPPAS